MHTDLRQGLGAAVVLGVLLVGGWGWGLSLRRWVRGERLLTHEPRDPAPWGLVDVLLALTVLGLLQSLADAVLQACCGPQLRLPLAAMEPEVQAAVLLIRAEATLAAAVISVALVRWRTGAPWQDLGFAFRSAGGDLRVGLLAFAMLAPLVYGLQWLLVQWLPSAHPLIVLLKQRHEPLVLGLTGVTAVIVAPVTEEYFFRVLLQGWLESLTTWVRWSGVAGVGRQPDGSHTGPLAPAVGRPAGGDSNSLANLGRTPTVRQEDGVVGEATTAVGLAPDVRPAVPPAVWPIAVSAGIFAALHAAHGPDPLPLFLLAVGLGYLYQRTHRILPCIVVHFLLNACSFARLLYEIYAARGA